MRVAFVLLSVAVGLAAAANFTGYIVTGQWDGKTVPSPQWAFDITRQDTEFAPKQELILQNLIPSYSGDGLSPSFSAYDAKTRTYLMSTALNETTGSIWGITIANDVGSATALSPPQVFFTFPEEDLTLVGAQLWSNNGALNLLHFYDNCTVMSVNFQTGASSLFMNICNYTRVATTAIEYNPAAQAVYVVTQAAEGAPERAIVTINLLAQTYTTAAIQPLKNHDPLDETPFEMLWLPNLNTLLVFYTGGFDQLIYTEPNSGMTSFAIFMLSEYGQQGQFEFTQEDGLEDDDTWSDAVIDLVAEKIYFQCSDVDPDTGFVTTTLCQIPVPKKIAPLDYVNTAIWPMTYGYVGMQYVQVVSN